MAEPFIATLTLNFTTRYLVPRLHGILNACLQQKAQVTCHFEKKQGRLI